MIQTNEMRVYYADTDAYGVVWHGTYLRWLEAGRIEYTDKILGLDLKKMQEEQHCLLPVIDLNIKYRSSAKLDDNLVMETKVSELRPSAIVFEQVIKNKETGTINITANVTCVALDTRTNKMYRRLPQYIVDSYNK